MCWETVLYKVRLDHCLMASTNVDGLRWLLRPSVPGRYEIDELCTTGVFNFRRKPGEGLGRKIRRRPSCASS